MGNMFPTNTGDPSPSTSDGTSHVKAVHSKQQLEELLGDPEGNQKASKLVVIDFSASWCGPCKFMEPVLEEMAARFPDVVFCKIDVDELSEVARARRVEAMPTFVLMKGGKEVGRVVGAKKDELERCINKWKA